jgi:hypothetical protein
VVIQMDHVPNWVSRPWSDRDLSEARPVLQHNTAKERHLYGDVSDASALPLLNNAEIAPINEFNHARITLILSQMIEHWFHPSLDPSGSVLPTVSVHFGPSGFLEDLDDSGFDTRNHKPTPPFFFQEWLTLRKRQRLDGLTTEVMIWQQEDARADELVHMRLLDHYRRIAVDKPIILIQHAYGPAWSTACREHAYRLNIILVMVGAGLNSLCLLTYSEFFLAAKEAEHRERQRTCQEKLKSGEGSWPVVFNHLDYHRLILVQHREMVRVNNATHAVLLGSVRTGLLARRPKTVEIPVIASNVHTGLLARCPKTVEIPVMASNMNGGFVIVETEAEACKFEGQRHWSMDKENTIVRSAHSITAGINLSFNDRQAPFQKPSFHQTFAFLQNTLFSNSNYGVPFTDLSNVLERIVTSQQFFGSFLERRAIARQNLSRLHSMSQDRFRLSSAKAIASVCTCKCDKPEHSPRCPTIYVNMYTMYAPQAKMIADKQRDNISKGIVSDQQRRCATNFCLKLPLARNLIQVPGAKVFGQKVVSVQQESGYSLFTKGDMPNAGDGSQPTLICSILKNLGATTLEFLEELAANQFCIDYALFALSNKK